jgi:hypothetical protein
MDLTEFIILLGLLYIIYKLTNKNILEKLTKKVTFDLKKNEYYNNSINDNLYTTDEKIFIKEPNTIIEDPVIHDFGNNLNVTSLSEILKDDIQITEHMVSYCNDNTRDNGNIFRYNDVENNCENLLTTNEKVNLFKNNIDSFHNKPIADVYDNMIDSGYKKPNKELMDNFQKYSYGDNNRKILKPDRWGYKNENAINGGLYKGNIYGYDPLIDNKLYI